MDKYFMINVVYSFPRKGCIVSGHVIKAHSEKEALDISINFGISNPRYSTDITKRRVRLLDTRERHVKNILNRRRSKIGGSIWYVENGILKEEIHADLKDSINDKNK